MDFRKMTLREKLAKLEEIRIDREINNLFWEEIMEKHNISLPRARHIYSESIRNYYRRNNDLWKLVIKHCGDMQSYVSTRVWNGLMRANIKNLYSLRSCTESRLRHTQGIGEKYIGIIMNMKADVDKRYTNPYQE